ncbi:aldehyde dehydrogenase family protein [Enterococcus sp.]|uniref:aldehyde dehydrogenase family protein n=1 Tax=Enterococcus sp. TaxID=35783 RepID=UPI0029071DFF|nr:aldehyde dehydrogenase family protein [Enterococcus sp.]MDU5335338.1 aldehyde dehydrogenase family protein [Enterococcus sp.]
MKYRVDNDLLSIQEARINIELARDAAKELKSFSQDQLDVVVEQMSQALRPHIEKLAKMAVEETDYGTFHDKVIKNRFVSEYLPQRLKNQRFVGILEEDNEQKLLKIGVPVGVIVSMIPATSPISTTIHNVLIAVKAGNAIVVSPHPRSKETVRGVIKLLAKTAEEAGYPPGAISCMQLISKKGTQELMEHPDVSLLMATGIPKIIDKLKHSTKPYIYGGSGNGPVFIERTCDTRQAVKDIIDSRTFDFGMVSSAEQSIVVDQPINQEIKNEFKRQGAYFMTEDEKQKLLNLLCKKDGSLNPAYVGKSAAYLASQAQLTVPPDTKLLIYEQPYVDESNPFAQEFLSPVLAYYVENDWQHACERCIELLMETLKSHTLVIHSRDEDVIRMFAMKKPVSRMLVNTPSTFGSMGATTNLFPSMTLGSNAFGIMASSDNISPEHLTTIRNIGYGVRGIEECFDKKKNDEAEETLEAVIKQLLEKIMKRGDEN